MRSAPDSCQTDLFVPEVLQILKLGTGYERVDQLLGGKPNGSRRHSPQGCAYRGGSHSRDILDLAAAERRVSNLRSDLNDLRLQSVGLKDLPLESSYQRQAANRIVRVGDSDPLRCYLRPQGRREKEKSGEND